MALRFGRRSFIHVPLIDTIAILAPCPSGYLKAAHTSVDVTDASNNVCESVPTSKSTLYMVYRETFLQVHILLLQLLILKN